MKSLIFSICAVALYIFRIYWLFFLPNVWNGDLQTGIIPALHCWYCVSYHAPYGILWYIASFPGLISPTEYILYVSIVDLIVMILLRNTKILFPVYLLASARLWFQAPYDIVILWFMPLGLISWPLIFLSILAKLPNSPGTIEYVLNSHGAGQRMFPVIGGFWDLYYYAFIGLVFVFTVLEILIQKRIKKWEKEKTTLTASSEPLG